MNNTIQESIIINGYIIYFNRIVAQTKSSKIFECRKVQDLKKNLIAKIVEDQNSILQKREEVIIEILKKQSSKNIHIVKMVDQFYYEPTKEWVQIQEQSLFNLQSRIDQLSSFQEDEALDVISQILKGYKFLYDQNIIHRDLKPDNILVDYVEGHYLYKICDFGVSKIIDSQESKLTLTGTPIYTSPEMSQSQCNNIKLAQDLALAKYYCDKPDHLIDIFSLGIIFYRIVFGNFPFRKNKEDIIKFQSNLEKDEFEMPVENNVSQVTKQMILSMIKFYPTKRITFPELMENDLIKKHLLKLETKFQNLYNCQTQIENYRNSNISIFPNQQLKLQQQQFQQDPKSQQILQQSQITLESSQQQQSKITLESSQQQQSKITLESSQQQKSQISIKPFQQQQQLKLKQQQPQFIQQQCFPLTQQAQQQSFLHPLQFSNPSSLRSFNPSIQSNIIQKIPQNQPYSQMPSNSNCKIISQKPDLNEDNITKCRKFNPSQVSMNQQIKQQADNGSTITINIQKHEENKSCFSNDDWDYIKNYLKQIKNCAKLMDEYSEQINYIINQQQSTQKCQNIFKNTYTILKNTYSKFKEHNEQFFQTVDKLLENTTQ